MRNGSGAIIDSTYSTLISFFILIQMEMTRDLYLTMLRQGSNGNQILEILNAITSNDDDQLVNNSMSNEDYQDDVNNSMSDEVEDYTYSEDDEEMVIENEEVMIG